MVSYAQAVLRLRSLVLAQTTLDEEVKKATADVLAAALEEAKVGGVVQELEDLLDRNALTMPTPRAFVPFDGTIRRDAPDSRTRASVRKVGSEEVERHIREAWLKAGADEPGRVRVRDMIYTSISTGSLDADARERLHKMTGS